MEDRKVASLIAPSRREEHTELYGLSNSFDSVRQLES
jgi:hypothetical protein